MRVLAVDSSGDWCAAGLWQDGDLLQAIGEPMRHGHAEALVPMILAVLDRAGCRAAECDILAATTGPGAFTGLRIGLAAVGGLALAAGRPIVGVSAFAALADAVPAERLAGRRLLAAIDSRRAEPYVQAFDADRRPLGEGFCTGPESLRRTMAGGDWAAVGSGAARAAALVPDLALEILGEGPVDLAVLARLAAARADDARPDPPPPLYLRPPDATPAASGRGRGR